MSDPDHHTEMEEHYADGRRIQDLELEIERLRSLVREAIPFMNDAGDDEDHEAQAVARAWLEKARRAEVERMRSLVREGPAAEVERLRAENRWLYDQLAAQREAYRELVSRHAQERK